MYDFHSWSKQRCEEAFGEAQRRSVANRAKGDRGTRFEVGRVGLALSGGMRGSRGYRFESQSRANNRSNEGKTKSINTTETREAERSLWERILALLEEDWPKVVTASRIEYGDVRKRAAGTRFHLRSTHQIADVMLVGKAPVEEAIEKLLKGLEVGVPADALDLLSVLASLSPGEYLALCRGGAKIAANPPRNLDSETLIQVVDPARASQLESLRPEEAVNRR